MSTLALVRHGQASFFADNYDQLSPLGEQQARLLGEYWVKRGQRFDAVFTGPRVRQIETAALAGEAFARADIPWPEPQFLPELDEHHVDRLIKQGIDTVMRDFPHVGPLHEAYHSATEPRDKQRTFQLMFEQVVMLWVQDKVAVDGVESWPAFRGRVEAGLKKITSVGSGCSVAAFTSVGAVTVGLQVSTGCPDRPAFDLGWRVRNCSVTDFIFSGDRLTMDSFNSLAHLEDPALWTFR
jgi:broad specificity phosphatase PhoE